MKDTFYVYDRPTVLDIAAVTVCIRNWWHIKNDFWPDHYWVLF